MSNRPQHAKSPSACQVARHCSRTLLRRGSVKQGGNKSVGKEGHHAGSNVARILCSPGTYRARRLASNT